MKVDVKYEWLPPTCSMVMLTTSALRRRYGSKKDKPSGDATKDLDKENQIPNVQASNSMPASPTRPNRETAKAEKESVTPTVIFFS